MFNTLSIKKPNSNSKTGFTIIELLVVIAIIGLISSVVLVSMKGSTGKAKIAKGLEFSQTTLNTIGHDAVGVWTFDEGSGGTANDKSGYRNHGTIHGATFVSGEENTPHWYVNEGEGRSALKFDGNDYVSIHANSIPRGDQITFELWAHGSDIQPTQNSVIEARDANNLRTLNIHLPWSNGNIYFDCGNNGVTYDRIYKTANASDYKGKWTHWVFTKNAATGDMEIYLNGSLWHSGTGKTYSLPVTTTVKLGSYTDRTHSYPGIIDEVRIYASALSSAEIQQHYVAGAKKHQIALK